MRSVIHGLFLAGSLVITILTYGCSDTQLLAASQRMPNNARDAHAPHPGTIVVTYAWDRSRVVLNAADLPDAFTFRCADSRGQAIAREEAEWCIPVVEIETISRDNAGRLVAPQTAAAITSLVYGPGHVLLESVESGPHGSASEPDTHRSEKDVK